MLAVYHRQELNAQDYARILRRSLANEKETYQSVLPILEDVQKNGLDAVSRYNQKWDGLLLSPQELFVTEEEFQKAEAKLAPELKEAFQEAYKNIHAFHALQKKSLISKETEIAGTRLGYRYLPMEGAAIYAPGGLAVYPSSVLMGLVPARLAGVRECILITPPSAAGQVHDALLYCAHLAGVHKVCKAGGVQGIAAAAYGFIGSPVSIIAGPGNRYVTAAKSILAAQGKVAIDLPAGPSEVLIIADDTAKPSFIAADMLSQAEHGPDSAAVLLCLSPSLLEAVQQELAAALQTRSRRRRAAMKRQSIQEHSFALVCQNWDEVYRFANDYAPEHLELCVAEPEKALDKISNAGSVFLGHYSPVALGDYYSGTNHILPTGGAARFRSGLGVDHFLKRISYQYASKESLRAAMPSILAMSRCEGFEEEHGRSVSLRFQDIL